ncbi:MAG TPA: TRAP transporter small permease [Afifellaceae bacterium]|nr:TRAP transporter small permease [Afifellaceae bacterium]
MRAKSIGFARKLVEWWALAGGVLLIAVVLMTTWSVFSGAVFGTPFPGDFELTEIGVAVAAFAFLPYCQITGSNVSADIFTSRAGPRVIAALTLLAALIAMAFSLLLLWRMWAGMIDYQKYLETTAILQIPLWTAFVPILCSLALLCLASVVTLVEATEKLAQGAATGSKPS